eukprot:GHVL01024952.1.p3 GENE.GHVL01024952.1~~GHVL01024952.1.p3  ORF type:complete len:233 (-),score=12.93 GHVL01024952.1:260-958(-)
MLRYRVPPHAATGRDDAAAALHGMGAWPAALWLSWVVVRVHVDRLARTAWRYRPRANHRRASRQRREPVCNDRTEERGHNDGVFRARWPDDGDAMRLARSGGGALHDGDGASVPGTGRARAVSRIGSAWRVRAVFRPARPDSARGRQPTCAGSACALRAPDRPRDRRTGGGTWRPGFSGVHGRDWRTQRGTARTRCGGTWLSGRQPGWRGQPSACRDHFQFSEPDSRGGGAY